ncbi:putative Ent-kaurene oxidase [Glarea lozoyensis 74030]|uniref:Putative Ent-kaurene oxidase n=1 Tax=Glarea lozoyensis (strain ATCC 74030 / MF5533) TaxID=1104152 RepID=H0EFH1_GLAL7|nr:putative Ent-kaurene oxidase [Glarea lozoyensis 74030]
MPEVRRHLRAIFDRHILSGPLKNGFFSPKLFPMLVECIAHSNIMSFFGEELEVVRVLPQAISPTVGRFLSRTFNSQNVIFDTLMPLVELRLEERERKKQGYEVPEHDPMKKKREFNSLHFQTACFVLHDLCLHPEYIPILRKDIERSGWGSFDQSKGQEFPLLDSFMKESSRLNPVEATLKPFELSGGHKVPVGEWVCTAPKAMHRDQVYWAKPLDFHGFRFVEPKLYDTILSATQFEVPEPGKQSAFNEVLDWQLWGTGRNACSGRFYATALVKTMLALLIMNYDMKLADPRRSKNSFVWRSFIYPYASTPILLKPRSVTF